MDSEPVRLAYTLSDEHRKDAARILYEAFRRKLYPLLKQPEQVQRLLRSSFIPGRMVSAVSGELLVGVAGLHFHRRHFCKASFHDCVRLLGRWHGLTGWLVLNLFLDGYCPPGDLRVSVLAVDEPYRGLGVGRMILESIIDTARREGFHSIRLEVVDTNPGAFRLYQRIGFQSVRRVPLGIFKDWLGFSAEFDMVYPL